TAVGSITLGRVNTFNSDGLVVGATKSSTGTRLGFAPGVLHPTFTLRGSTGGSSRAGVFSMGDVSAQEYDYLGSPGNVANGLADFTGGIVDIRADSIYVSRSGPDVGNGFGAASGILLIERGVADANNLHIAYKQG